MLGLALDLDLRPQSLHDQLSRLDDRALACSDWRGVAVALTAPLFALGRAPRRGLANPAVARSDVPVALAARDLRLFRADGDRRDGASRDRRRLVGALHDRRAGGDDRRRDGPDPERRVRAAGSRSKLAKHLFEHRYDYRTEWLRFTETLGRAGPGRAAARRADRQGLRRHRRRARRTAAGQRRRPRHWPSPPAGIGPAANPPADELEDAGDFWARARGERPHRSSSRRCAAAGQARATRPLPIPPWLARRAQAWAAIPLIHHERLVGLVILAAPEYRRPLDWEDFDLLRTAGRQAASSLAEALGQEALANAQRFEEFNRRFAFILHDIKNLVSQLSLLARNAERHADNPEFRTDMVATLQVFGRQDERPAGAACRREPQSRVAADRARSRCGRSSPRPSPRKRGDRDVQLLGDAGAVGRSRRHRARAGGRPSCPERARSQPADRAGDGPR